MAVSQWFLYDKYLTNKNNGTINIFTDAFSVALLTSSYIPDLAINDVWADISGNETTQVNGYIGPVVSAQTITLSANNLNFNMADVEWTANGGSITCRYAAIKHDLTGALVAYIEIDEADVIITDTKSLNIDISTNSVYDETIT